MASQVPPLLIFDVVIPCPKIAFRKKLRPRLKWIPLSYIVVCGGCIFELSVVSSWWWWDIDNMVSRVVDDDIWLLNGLFVKFWQFATSGIFKQLPLLKSVWKEQKKNMVSLVSCSSWFLLLFFVFLTDIYEINGKSRIF